MTEEKKEMIAALIEQKMEDVTVMRLTVEKNNRTCKDGICIRKAGQNSGPITYWDDILALCGEEYDDSTMADCIICIVAPYLDFSADRQEILCWEKCKDKVLPKLINAERNQERPKNLVHRKYLDLAEIYYTRIVVGDGSQGNTEGTCALLKEWGIDQETLERQAAENMKKQEYRLNSLEEMLGGVIPAESDTGTEKVPLQILTNREGIFGAAILGNPEFLKEVLGNEVGDCYLLPSSVHELIVCPVESWMDEESLQEVVKEVNRNVVSEVDYLSDKVYYYNMNFVEISRVKGEEKI